MEASPTPPRPLAPHRRFAGPFHLSVTILIGVLLAAPVVPPNSALPAIVVYGLLASAIMLAIQASHCAPWHRVVGGTLFVLVGLGIGLKGVGFTLPDDSLRGAYGLLTLIGVKATLTSVLRPTRVDTDKIFAAICGFLLMGLFWANLYESIDQKVLGAFTGSDRIGDSLSINDRSLELIYFSFVTLTTLGYGDISPIHPFARSVATIQALTGQLYLAILVARLVALHIVHSKEEEDGVA